MNRKILYAIFSLLMGCTPAVTIDRETLLGRPDMPSAVSFERRFLFLRFPAKVLSAEASPGGSYEAFFRGNTVYLASRSLQAGGTVTLTVHAEGTNFTQDFPVTLPADDRDSDGYPDVLTVRNASAFRDWFCAIVESQFYADSDRWYDVHRDCAGVIEFAFREALKRHDREWAKGFRYLSDTTIPDPADWRYPDTPFLFDRIFRVTPGAFDETRVTNDFSPAGGGDVLRNCSMRFVSRELGQLLKGDVLYFLHPENTHMPLHAMVYLGPVGGSTQDGFLVYHTGPGENTKGFMKKVRVRELSRHPDPSWRPVPENPAFLGAWRWKLAY